MGQPKKKKKKGLGFATPSSRIPRLAARAPPPKSSLPVSLPAGSPSVSSQTPDLDLPSSRPALVSDLEISDLDGSLKISGYAQIDSVVVGPSSNVVSPVSLEVSNPPQKSTLEAPISSGTPTSHVSGAPFVLIPDENIDEAKEEFKEFIFARFRGDIPTKGRIIGVVNAIWGHSGPRIYVHKLGEGCFLLKVTSQRTREILLSRPALMIAGSPMFVAPWSSDFSHEEPQLTIAVVPVEMRGVPYLFFNQKSLSRLSTAIGKPVSLAPETERKENFEVAKIWVKINLFEDLPSRIVTGFSNGREIDIAVSYPWLPKKCPQCDKFGHNEDHCPLSVALGLKATCDGKRAPGKTRRRSRSRPSKSKRSHDHHGSSPGAHEVDVQQVTPQQDVRQCDTHQEAPASELMGSSPANQSTALFTAQTEVDTNTNPASGNSVSSEGTSKELLPAPSPVISLNRQIGYAASVTVFHEVNEPSQAHDQTSECDAEDPFFLVSNRKCSRKATKN
ncbi:hypothetical protein DY000_02045927 [Brassica cretica]|uniref:DUF4283 domain-containing protein n=1 Tax=Brassica cretica TaxID=69181 RepID=A0ABQ7ENL9_BRACR|nr:hypothetical protein DY000_02045927 [Brassica cretica]